MVTIFLSQERCITIVYFTVPDDFFLVADLSRLLVVPLDQPDDHSDDHLILTEGNVLTTTYSAVVLDQANRLVYVSDSTR